MKELTKLSQPVIIATKGLPCTGKSEIARLIALWAKCSVFYIDHFLDTLSLEKGYTAELLPSPEEAERLHRLSFDALCKAASHALRWGVDSYQWPRKCIVIKARLCSAFELDRLLQLARDHGCGMVLIIEFRVKNEYRFRLRLDHKVELGGQEEWYKPRGWKDIEKAKDDYDAENCDLHIRLLDSKGDGLPVTRLVLDPFDNLYIVPNAYLPSKCQRIINFLLCGGDLFVGGRYEAVHFEKVDRYLREKDIRGPRSTLYNNKYLCHARSKGYYCKFRYWEELEDDVDDEGKPYYCGVCEELVISGQAAYGCQTCTLTLHKACAELGDFTLEGYQDVEILRYYPKFLPQQHACKSCLGGGKHFSHGCDSCKFQTHLKCRALPTILTHDCHDHFLFMAIKWLYKCNACGIDRDNFGGTYRCYICDKNYDIECLSLVRKGEHEHGGHQHLLKLIYSRDGMEEDESYWCDICYEDIDPQNWFYYCQDCPYFSAHPNCVRPSIRIGGDH